MLPVLKTHDRQLLMFFHLVCTWAEDRGPADLRVAQLIVLESRQGSLLLLSAVFALVDLHASALLFRAPLTALLLFRLWL
jgi:hypothetical protein